MMEKMRSAIEAAFPVEPLDCGEFAVMKHSGMTFHVCAYRVRGLGHLSIMTASGFFGLMKMDTLILNPTELDLPLFSYDRVLAMGNDTLIYELYDTLLTDCDLSALEEVKANAKDLPEHDLGAHWYDGIKLPVSLSKKGKKAHRTAFDRCAMEYLLAYLTAARTAHPCAAGPKREKASVYVEGLLEKGGPSTDVFLKGMGREKTQALFRKVLFGTQV